MSKLKVFSIRDSKAEVYNQPWFAKTYGDGERTFHKITNDPQSMVNTYPDDFDLYCLGEYDDQSGLLVPLDTPKHIIKGVQVVDKKTALPTELKALQQ